MSASTAAELRSMNAEYRRITGEDAYLYANRPTDTGQTRYHFSTAPVWLNESRAMVHMRRVLERAREGRTHDEIKDSSHLY